MSAAGTVGVAFLSWFVLNQFRKAVRRMDPAVVRAIIERVNAQEFGGWFEVADVMAVVDIESSFDPEARRFEARLNDASLGLMQTLYSTAQDRGLVGGPASLFDPETSIRIGMRQLRWSWDFLEARMGEAPPRQVWIGSYNGGVGNALRGWFPASYVAKWQKARDRWNSS